jgi:hypothetical protein
VKVHKGVRYIILDVEAGVLEVTSWDCKEICYINISAKLESCDLSTSQERIKVVL